MRSTLALLFVVAASLVFAAGAQAADLFCTGGDGTRLAKVDTGTATGSDLGATGSSGVYAAAFDETDGTLYTTVNWGEYLGTLDLATGAVTTIGPSHAAAAILVALEVSPTGVLYGLDWAGGLWTIDKSTGVRTLVGYGYVYYAMDLAFDASGTLWAANGNYLYTIDTTYGSAIPQGPVTGVSDGSIMSIAFDEDDTLYAMTYTANGSLYVVDATTRAATLVGATGLYFPHGGDILGVGDSDGDGIPDDEDHCVDSDLRPTVVIDGIDTGVANTLFADGCTIADRVAACAADAQNHGAFVSAVAALTNDLAGSGAITGKDKGALQSAAGRSSIGK